MFGLRFESFIIFSHGLVMISPLMDQINELNASIRSNKKQIYLLTNKFILLTLLHLLTNYISVIRKTQILSMKDKCTLGFQNVLIIDLCNSVNCCFDEMPVGTPRSGIFS